MRRISVTLAGLLILGIGGWPPSSVDGTSCPAPEVTLSQARLLALEQDNGCADEDVAPVQGVWPDWRSATVAGAMCRRRASSPTLTRPSTALPSTPSTVACS